MVPVISAIVVCLVAGSAIFFVRSSRLAAARTIPAPARPKDKRDQPEQDQVFGKRQRILQCLAPELGKNHTTRVTVSDLMSPLATTVLPVTSAKHARKLMEESRVRHLLVVGANQELVGVISDRDLATSAQTAAEMMTANPVTVEPHTLLSPAITLLLRRKISCLPVVESGKLLGVLTTTDLLLYLQCVLQSLQKAELSTTQASEAAAEQAIPAEVACSDV